jgi:uncharacterized protein with NRDE domain
MCTVTYIPDKKKSGFVLTSNRDEVAYRPTFAPKRYRVNSNDLYFPKDSVAGGSWISANKNGRTVCLLNGAFLPHKRKSKYAQSRGNITIELASFQGNPEQYFYEKDLSEIEPFTIVTVEKSKNEISHLSEFIWDGNKKHFKILDQSKSYIWSSVTLYSEEHRKMRKEWFQGFMKKINGSVSSENILDFHSAKHIEDDSINVIMQREGDLKTVSITQIIACDTATKMKYFDLHNHTKTEVEI